MNIQRRIEKLEQQDQEKKFAVFTVHRGRASGLAFWRDDLSWKNLTKPELEALQKELEADGAEVMVINVVAVAPDGSRKDGWEER